MTYFIVTNRINKWSVGSRRCQRKSRHRGRMLADGTHQMSSSQLPVLSAYAQDAVRRIMCHCQTSIGCSFQTDVLRLYAMPSSFGIIGHFNIVRQPSRHSAAPVPSSSGATLNRALTNNDVNNKTWYQRPNGTRNANMHIMNAARWRGVLFRYGERRAVGRNRNC